LNKLILDGRLTDNPVFTPNQEENKQRVNFSLAHNHNKEKATFFRCSAWGKTAGNIAKLIKGQRLLIEGEVEENEWTDQQGAKRSDKQVNVRGITFIDFPEQQQTQTNQPPATPPGYQQPGYNNQPPQQGYNQAPPGYGQPAGYPPQNQWGAPPQQQPPGYGMQQQTQAPQGYPSQQQTAPQQGYGATPVRPF